VYLDCDFQFAVATTGYAETWPVSALGEKNTFSIVAKPSCSSNRSSSSVVLQHDGGCVADRLCFGSFLWGPARRPHGHVRPEATGRIQCAGGRGRRRHNIVGERRVRPESHAARQ